MKIAVLYGGVSGEREVSISSGRGIMEALERNGHEVIGIDFHPDELHKVTELEVDLVFIGLHGKFGEDGCVQGLLEMLNLPYVGSGVLASALAMDKSKAKESFERAGIPVAKSKSYQLLHQDDVTEIAQDIYENWQPPFVIKPNREGSTLGLSIIQDKEQIAEAVKLAFASDHTLLVEDFVSGKELTVPVVGEIGHERALPAIEIIPKNELYDYESKYAPGGSEHIVPARIDEGITKTIQDYAVLAHQVLGCKTYSRVDFLLTDQGTPIILEVNTLPGMTPTSLFPDAARHIGLSYDEMIEEFVQLSKR
ncbi:MAG TPA: D-alanine--D-alanine ligase [Candidatus Avamphibacillus intestinigallinarum]|nr:D-alanine--D-alanine ligase [Candidatus Avamphibacillus intestinigallinarum]